MNSNFRSFTPTSKKTPILSPSLWFKQEEATSDNWHSPSAHLHNHHHHRHLHPVSLATPPIHLPLSSLHSSSSSFHRWAHSACSLSQQPRRVGLIPAVPGGAVAGPSTRFHLPLLAPRSGKPPPLPHRHRRLSHLAHLTKTCCRQPCYHSLLHPTDAPQSTHHPLSLLNPVMFKSNV